MMSIEEKLEAEAKEAISPGINQYTKRSAAEASDDHLSKEVARKIADKADVERKGFQNGNGYMSLLPGLMRMP